MVNPPRKSGGTKISHISLAVVSKSHKKGFDNKVTPVDKKSVHLPAGLWIDIEDIGDEGLNVDFIKNPSYFDFSDRDFKIVKDVTMNCTLTRCDGDIYLNGKFLTVVELTCSRCIDNFTDEISAEFSAEYLPEKGESSNKEELELMESDLNVSYYTGDSIDILPTVRDQILLSISIKPLCKENCLGLCPHCGQNLNISKCNCKEDDIDERLAVLKKIKL